jgi:hypothetical protein
MTWKELKETVEGKGVRDDDEIYRIKVVYPKPEEVHVSRPYEDNVVEILN